MESSAKSPAHFYEPGLDVLRFVAFLMVFLSHAFPALAWQVDYPSRLAVWRATLIQAGAFGVDIFFALSAFLITTLLAAEYREHGSIRLSAFYMRRSLRIWPLYYVFLIAICFMLPRWLPLSPLPPTYRPGFFLFYGNWLCALRGYSHSSADILWSVSVEEQFYVIWPLLLWITAFSGVALLSTLFFAIGFAVQAMLVYQSAVHPALWCNTMVCFEPLAVGAALAVLWTHRRVFSRFKQWIGGSVAVAGFIMAACICPTLDGPLSLFAYPLVAAVSGLMVVLFLGWSQPQSVIGKTLIYLGKISYGLYVVHLAVLSVIPHRPLCALLITILLAHLSYQFLESPFLRLKNRF